jgi:hypothetical protein
MSLSRPWEAGPFEPWVMSALEKRVQNLSSGINQVPSGLTGNMNYLSGPKRHWIRAFSNGFVADPSENISSQLKDDPARARAMSAQKMTRDADNNNEWGLILKSASTLEQRFGIKSPQDSYGKQVYGFSNRNNPKFIKNPKYRIQVPEPGITSIETEVQVNFYSKAKINWVCHSIDQLEAITPYFLTPLTIIFLEWGWNDFNEQSLINISDIKELKNIWENHYVHLKDRVPRSNGNYDFILGHVKNFEYSIEDNIIKGFTEIASRQLLQSGFPTRGQMIPDTNQGASISTPASSFKSTFENTLKALFFYSSNKDLPVNTTNKPITPKPEPESIGTIDKIKGVFSDNAKNNNETRVKNQSDGINNVKRLLSPYKKYGKDLEFLDQYIYKYVTDGKQKGENQDNGMKDTYITLELLVDLLNAIKNDNKNYFKDFFDVDVEKTWAGYHENLISTTKNVLIPNPKSPKFNFKKSWPYTIYSDDNTKFIDDNETGKPRKKGQNVNPANGLFEVKSTPVNPSKKNNPKNANTQLMLLMGVSTGISYRSNLDYVLNEYGRNTRRQNSEFGEDKPDPNNPSRNIKFGKLKNVYVNLNFILETIVFDENKLDLKSTYDDILEEVSKSVGYFWDIQLVDVNGTDAKNTSLTGVSNRLQITDMKYQMLESKIFTFDYGSKESIIKKLSFTTTLSNYQSAQILYKSFNQQTLSPNDLVDFTEGGRFKDRINMEIVSELNRKKEGRNTAYSEQLKTFLSIMSKYQKFDEDDPAPNGLMRVQTFETKEQPPGGRGFGKPTKVLDKNKYNIADLILPELETLMFLLNDGDVENNNSIYNAPIRNVEIDLALMGIAGIKTFQYFAIRNLPPPFTEERVVFQVRDVVNTIDENTWETKIKASLRPSRNLGIKFKI